MTALTKASSATKWTNSALREAKRESLFLASDGVALNEAKAKAYFSSEAKAKAPSSGASASEVSDV